MIEKIGKYYNLYAVFIEKCHNKFARELKKDIGIEIHALSKIDDDK